MAGPFNRPRARRIVLIPLTVKWRLWYSPDTKACLIIHHLFRAIPFIQGESIKRLPPSNADLTVCCSLKYNERSLGLIAPLAGELEQGGKAPPESTGDLFSIFFKR